VTVAQDAHRGVVVPVVQDVAEQVQVSRVGKRVEEVAGDSLAAVRHAGAFQYLARASHDVGQVD
jgi:hypothetical protein